MNDCSNTPSSLLTVVAPEECQLPRRGPRLFLGHVRVGLALRVLGNLAPRLNEEPSGMLATSPTRGRLTRPALPGQQHCYHPELQVLSAGFRAHLTLPTSHIDGLLRPKCDRRSENTGQPSSDHIECDDPICHWRNRDAGLLLFRANLGSTRCGRPFTHTIAVVPALSGAADFLSCPWSACHRRRQ